MSGQLEETAASLCDTHDMVVVHRVFRREFRLLTGMIATVPAGDTARAALVAAHATEMVAALHHHHRGEDELLWPRLQERAALSTQLLDAMAEQHEYIDGVLDHAAVMLPHWARTGDRLEGRRLAAHFDDISAALDQHLLQEENEVLPVVEAWITAEEWAELGRRGMASIPNNRLLVFLGYILEDATPAEQAHFLAKVPLPGRVAYRLIGRRKYLRERDNLRTTIARG